MAGRKKTIPDNAEGTTVYLTPEEFVVLRVILARRKKRKSPRSTQNEIIVDGLWHLLTDIEGIQRLKIEELLAVETDEATTNLTEFPKKG